MPRDQAAEAQHLYDERSDVYDDSWHPRFARHVVELIEPQPGEHVLDLACGTGLVSFAASEAVGATGSVVGVDISRRMLAQASSKLNTHELKNLDFYQHSITDLDSLEAIKDRKFDVITCASALVLLEHASQALKHWVGFLKEGGKLITDATHPRSQLVYITLELVGKKLGKPMPFDRLPFQEPGDLQRMMEDAGLCDVDVKLMSQTRLKTEDDRQDLAAYIYDAGSPVVERVWKITDAMSNFDQVVTSKAAKSLASDDVKEQARSLFNKEWMKLAGSDGRIEEIDGVFVGIGTKP